MKQRRGSSKSITSGLYFKRQFSIFLKKNYILLMATPFQSMALWRSVRRKLRQDVCLFVCLSFFYPYGLTTGSWKFFSNGKFPQSKYRTSSLREELISYVFECLWCALEGSDSLNVYRGPKKHWDKCISKATIGVRGRFRQKGGREVRKKLNLLSFERLRRQCVIVGEGSLEQDKIVFEFCPDA